MKTFFRHKAETEKREKLIVDSRKRLHNPIEYHQTMMIISTVLTIFFPLSIFRVRCLEIKHYQLGRRAALEAAKNREQLR